MRSRWGQIVSDSRLPAQCRADGAVKLSTSWVERDQPPHARGRSTVLNRMPPFFQVLPEKSWCRVRSSIADPPSRVVVACARSNVSSDCRAGLSPRVLAQGVECTFVDNRVDPCLDAPISHRVATERSGGPWCRIPEQRRLSVTHNVNNTASAVNLLSERRCSFYGDPSPESAYILRCESTGHHRGLESLLLPETREIVRRCARG